MSHLGNNTIRKLLITYKKILLGSYNIFNWAKFTRQSFLPRNKAGGVYNRPFETFFLEPSLQSPIYYFLSIRYWQCFM